MYFFLYGGTYCMYNEKEIFCLVMIIVFRFFYLEMIISFSFLFIFGAVFECFSLKD